MAQQLTNFIPTSSWKMNENFKLATKHDIVVIHNPCVKSRDIVLYATFHLRKELQGLNIAIDGIHNLIQINATRRPFTL
jgi:hypothetical protein